MRVSDCVDTALTRARQARLPSPWTEAVDFLDLGARASKKVEHWRARLCGKTEKIDSLWTGRGILRPERAAGALHCASRSTEICYELATGNCRRNFNPSS